MNTRALLGAAIWSVMLPQAVPAQTTESLREYARSVHAAEQGAGHLHHLPNDYMNTGASLGTWARALADVTPPSGYERLHATLVRNARTVASMSNRMRMPPTAGIDACTGSTVNASQNCPDANIVVPQGVEQRLNAAVNQYFAARERLARRLKAAGVAAPGWPGNVTSQP
jgi:hypothetical protein